MREYPYAFHIALDGNGLDGLEGRAGACVFRYDPATGDHAYKVQYFDGAAGGHAPNVDPTRRVGFLGNTGQHLLFYDPATLAEVDRVSTLRFEVPDTTLKGSTHLVWLDDTRFVTSIGEHLWTLDVNQLGKAEVVAPHALKAPHAMKRTASGRYIVYGGMDHPQRGEAKEVGILDTFTGAVRRVTLPTTCWHLVCHPVLDVFYAISFRVQPANGRDWGRWGMAWLREYAFEVDAEQGHVLRHWVGQRDLPAHINSDVTISDSELIFCTGGSHTVVLVDLATLRHHRLIDEHPGALHGLSYPRETLSTIAESFMRGNVFTNSHVYAESLRVARGAFIDGIYACQLSADQRLLFTANRGRNHITVYDYPALTVRDRVVMPSLREFAADAPEWADSRLGFHHSHLVSPSITEQTFGGD
ncbi:MAG TPA: hypothetical protein VI248_16470 [Kineosporiaceae bacterium]